MLHTYAAALPDSLDCSSRDTILPVVPMFHVNAWGLPYVACMVGAKLVFPGPWLDGKSLHDLFETEGVTMAAGVPTVWQGLLAHVEAKDLEFSSLERTVIGGSTCPPAMMDAFEDKHGVQVIHAWGMTELSPMGALGQLKGKHLEARRGATPDTAGEAGPLAVWHRYESRGRGRQRTSPRRPDFGRADGARSLGYCPLLQG